jgi:hypothetical protein
MRGLLLTGLGAKRPGSCLSGAIFSGPDDCADLVNFLQASEKRYFLRLNLSASIPVFLAESGQKSNFGWLWHIDFSSFSVSWPRGYFLPLGTMCAFKATGKLV